MRAVGGINEVNLHGMTKKQAKAFLDGRLRHLDASVYRVRVIHGYNGGTELRDMVREEYKKHPKVRRIEHGVNPGETYLVIREL